MEDKKKHTLKCRARTEPGTLKAYNLKNKGEERVISYIIFVRQRISFHKDFYVRQ